MNLTNWISAKKELIFKLIALGLIVLLYLGRGFHDFKKPLVLGDGFEYILMTEAITSHGSPNVTLEDHLNFKKKFEKYHKWDDFYQRGFFDTQVLNFTQTKSEYKETINGFFCTKNKHWYSYHFFFYSLINAPMYMIGAHYGPLRPFYFTNAILVILTCIVILFYTPFRWYNSVIAAFAFAYSATYWYLGWQHTEVITMCLVAISLINYFNKNYFWALFYTALACLQNQPLLLLFGFLAIEAVLKSGINKRSLFLISLTGLIAILPPLFYLVNFETTNLIKDAGYLSTKYITLNRVTGFYFDINQGMILSIPFILITYLVLCIRNVVIVIKDKTKFEFSMLLVFVLLAISMSVSTMGNWNHGMAIINRYASWLSVIVIIHTFYLMETIPLLGRTILMNYFFVTNCFTQIYHDQFNDSGWSAFRHTPLAKWVIRNYPQYYNPDPCIFSWRTQPFVKLEPKNSPFVFFKGNEVKKILVNKTKIDDLLNFGFTKKELETIKSKIHYNFDWGYVDQDIINSITDPLRIKAVVRERRVVAAYDKILNNHDWCEQIKKKASDWGKTFEEVLRMDAEYAVSFDEKAEQEE